MEAWASQKSFPLEDLEDREVEGSDFCGQSRSHATHAAVTDPDARLCTKAPDEVARRLCQEYSRTPADRVHLRRDENRGRNAQDAIPWIGSGESALLPGGHRLQPGADGATEGGLMEFVCPEFVRELQKAGSKAKTAVPALVSRDVVAEYPDLEQLFNIF